MGRKLLMLARVSFVGLISALIFTLFALTPARAATITVMDGSDSGPGTLRQALLDASDNDTIQLNVSPIDLTSAQLTVDKNVTITGAPGLVTVNAALVPWPSRVFLINPGKTVTLTSLEIREGHAIGDYGGGIRNFGNLTINSCQIQYNEADDGGGVYTDDGSTLTINDGSICNNTAKMSGGGFYNRGTTTINRVHFYSNNLGTNPLAGAAIHNNTTSGSLTIDQSKIEDNGNSTMPGGVTLGFNGGGISNISGNLTISNTTIKANSAGKGAVGGTGYDGYPGGHGGGIYSLAGSGSISLTNCTVANNNAGKGGDGPGVLDGSRKGGLGGKGGGIYHNSSTSTVTLIYCTVAFNHAGNGGDNSTGYPGGNGGDGGGIWNGAPASFLYLNNSIVSNNEVGYGGADTPLGSPGNFPEIFGAYYCNYTLIKDGDGGTPFDGTGCQIGTDPSPVDPNLQTWNNNGSQTPTCAIDQLSPAYNAANPTTCPPNPGVSRDQRNITRPQGGGCDLGAYEYSTFQVNVSIGTGSGTITDGPPPLYFNCGALCTATLMPAPTDTSLRQVTLQANPTAGYSFSNWTGDCSGTTPSYILTVNGAKSCTANFSLTSPVTLNVVVSPVGAGTVQSSPSGISCPTTCGATFPQNSTVNLTASPLAGYQFDHWEGDLTGTSSTTPINMDTTKNVTAVFVPAGVAVPLNLVISPVGTGSVQSSPAGINCPTTCNGLFPQNSIVTLTATPVAGYQFDHWEGDLTGTNATINVTMNTGKNITAVFVTAQVFETLIVSVSPSDSGKIKSSPSGIDCPATCNALFPHDGQVTLTTVFNSGYEFDHWEGDLTGTGNQKSLVMNGPKQATAFFKKVTTYSLVIPPGTQSTDYRIISLPFEPSSPRLADLIGSQIGTYDSTKERIGHWDGPTQAYFEYPNGDPISAGWAGWFLIQGGLNFSAAGSSVQTTSGPNGLLGFYYPLYPGWNMLGNPYPFQISVADIWVVEHDNTSKLLTDSANTITQTIFWGYDSTGYTSTLVLPSAMGGWVKKLTAQPGWLFYPAIEYTGSGPAMMEVTERDTERPPSPPSGLTSPSPKGSGGGGGCFISAIEAN